MRTILFAGVIALASSFALAGPTTQPSLEKENAELKAYVARLEGQVASLKAQLKTTTKFSGGTLRIIPPQMDLRSGQLNLVAPNTIQPAAPKGWVPQQFNGTTHYLVPLENDGPFSELPPSSLQLVKPAAPAK